MSEVERYAFVVSEDYVGAKPREDGAYVLYGDYTALQKKLDAALAENAFKLTSELKAQRDALADKEGYKQAFYEMAEILCIGARPDSPKNVFELVIKPKLEALMKQRGKLASENLTLANLITSWPQEQCPVTGAVTDVQPDDIFPETNTYINCVRAEGICFAANRILAAWDSGFIDDTPAQAYDISGAVLSAVEFLPDASPEDFNRDFADNIRAEIAAKPRAETDTTSSQYESLAGGK